MNALLSPVIAIDKFALEQSLEVFECCGQLFFPLYGASGGLRSDVIAYFRVPPHSWPEGVEFGRAGQSAIGIWAVEFSSRWSGEQVLAHLRAKWEAHQRSYDHA